MAILYIDFEDGDNNYGGTSFDLLASGTNGRISGSTFSSTGANFADDGSLIDQYLSIFNGTIYIVYVITARLSSTSLTISPISGGWALADQSTDRQYYIGGRWKDFANVSVTTTPNKIITDDIFRIKSSPPPTSLGIDTTWTSAVRASTISLVSSTNASPISITANDHGYSSGDTVIVTGHTTNTNANGTWEITVTGTNTFTLNNSTGNGTGGAAGTVRLINNSVIRLASSLTQNIASFGNIGEGRTAWTASANATATLSTTDFKEGNCSDSIAVVAAFTTGLVAYKNLGTTLNLSNYQQISFWIKQTAGTVASANDLTINLCSDAAGTTIVDSFNVEGTVVLNRWFPVTINKGSNLGSSIQSIALVLNVDRGAQTFLISNIIACKAVSSDDSLTLQSLIGKNQVNEPWCTIQSINGTRVLIDQQSQTLPNAAATRGYFGVSETVTGYKRETIKTPMANAAIANNALSLSNYTGNENNIYIEGGYDRTNMSSITDYTFFDGRNNFGRLCSYIITRSGSVKNLCAIRYSSAFYRQDGGAGFQNILLNNLQTYSNTIGIEFNNNTLDNYIDGLISYFDSTMIYLLNISTLHKVSNVYGGCTDTSTSNGLGTDRGAIILTAGGNHILDNINLFNNTNGIWINGGNSLFNTIKNSKLEYNNYGILINNSSHSQIINSTFENNILGSIYSTIGTHIFFKNCIFNDLLEFSTQRSQVNSYIYSQNHDNVNNYHLITAGQGIISSDNEVTQNNSGISWRFAPTSLISDKYPLILELAKVAVSANSPVIVSAWVRRNNVNMSLGIRLDGGQIAGVDNNVESFITAPIDTWEQISFSFTPTESGVVIINAVCNGGNTRLGYIDNISITQ
jgi:hypothetical protein